MKDKVLEELSKLGVSSSSFKIVCHLTFRGRPLKPKEIAEELKVKPASVRARLSELCERNLVTSGSKGYTSMVKPYDILMKIYSDLRERGGMSKVE